ncbi:MAG TPA: ABC transporter permease, partial [Gemmatimonadaceae bacterium]|nr:ABC transporter permease [Gemmatimonadaceae bacterium]
KRFFRLPTRGAGVEQDVDAEVEFHIAMRADDLIAQGLGRDSALRQAAAEFGDVADARRELSEIDRRRVATTEREEWWSGLAHDAGIATRAFRRTPAFTIVVLVTLAIGIGANTAMFSVVNAVLLRPLPYAEPERLVSIAETHGGDVAHLSEASYPDFLDWRRQRDVFAAVEGFDESNVTLADAGGGELVGAARVTSGFFDLLGVRPLYGRGFDSADDAPLGTPAVVLSYSTWVDRFASDPGVVGRTMLIDGRAHEVRGVLPPSFAFAPAGDAQVWLPIGRNAEVRGQRFNHWVRVVARLAGGVSVDAARARMGGVMRDLAVRYPESNEGRGVQITTLVQDIVGNTERPLLVLLGAVAIVLLIACANVGSLVLARSVDRGREIAVRSAIGASRGRIVRQLLTENLVLAVAGALVGVWLASQSVGAFVARLPVSVLDQMPALRHASVDLRALGFTTAVALLTALLFGLAPALLATRRSVAEFLRSDARAGGSRGRHRLRESLVVAEIALTLVLLVGAALMGRSVAALLRVNPGFSAERVATVRVALAGPRYAEQFAPSQFFAQAVVRVQRLPNVDAAGAISSAPLQGGGTNTFHVEGLPEPAPALRPEAVTRAVAGEYFRALRIPVIEGRVLNDRDDLHAPYAIVMSESLARQLFGHESAVGRRVRFYAWKDSAWTVVGVVGDVKTDALDQPVRPTIYYSHLQGPANRMSIVARSRGDAASLVPSMRRIIAELDPTVAVYRGGTMSEYVSASQAVASRRYVLFALGAFAAIALFLAIIGVYGVIAYNVSQRTREIAVRVALGAQASQVLTLVLGEGLRVVIVGLAIGAAVALAVSRTLASLLYGVGSHDLTTYASVSALLLLVAMLATLLPARRTLDVDPARLLRGD